MESKARGELLSNSLVFDRRDGTAAFTNLFVFVTFGRAPSGIRNTDEFDGLFAGDVFGLEDEHGDDVA